MTLNGDLEALQKLVDGALASLEANRERIDDLNVYPVPDGDTGTNLTMTVRAVDEAVDTTSAASRESLARDVARGALMGARGNSGVIFSQIVRGAADVLGTVDGTAIAVDAPARALRGASDAAYRGERGRAASESELERLGDSLLVVGDPSAVKVHVHTNEPGAALQIGTRSGTIDRIEIANMHEQTHKREERLLAAVPDTPPAQCGVV